MAENVLVIPDLHFPDTDARLWKLTLDLIRSEKPDRIIQIGDFMDYPQPSRWTKGTKAEFEGSVFKDSEKAVETLIKSLRDVFDGQIQVHEGNHDLRPRTYLTKYAPALADTDSFNFEKLLRFDEYDIELLPDFYKLAPGWITTHGHVGGIRLNQNAGMTALNGAKRLGVSIVMGHTHRAGISSYTMGFGGSGNTLTGVEVGHLMDTKKVSYLNGATGNWQQSLTWLTVDGKNVTANLLPVQNRKIVMKERTITA